MKLTPVRSKIEQPTCLLPENFTGEWINTANIDADVSINSTHIVELWHPGKINVKRNITKKVKGKQS